jgi:precorrin-2 dehydrogenase/sirohydrochlorin ferrochelatase
MIPLFVDLSTKRIVIFGGGVVAARKAAYFARKAEVQVFSRSFSKKISTLPVKRTVMDVARASDMDLEDLLHKSFIGIAALSDREQNNRIGTICRRLGILFNNADGEKGDLIIPSVLCSKYYTIAVSTGGKSPAVSRFIREHLETRFSRIDRMIILQERLRQKLKSVEPSQKKRGEILREVLHDPAIWEALYRSRKEAEGIVNRRYLHE